MRWGGVFCRTRRASGHRQPTQYWIEPSPKFKCPPIYQTHTVEASVKVPRLSSFGTPRPHDCWNGTSVDVTEASWDHAAGHVGRGDRRPQRSGALMRRAISPPQVTHLAKNRRRASPARAKGPIKSGSELARQRVTRPRRVSHPLPISRVDGILIYEMSLRD